MTSPTIVERAFQLAQSGAFPDVADVRKQLKSEGYSATMVEAHLQGSLSKQLRELCRSSAAS